MTRSDGASPAEIGKLLDEHEEASARWRLSEERILPQVVNAPDKTRLAVVRSAIESLFATLLSKNEGLEWDVESYRNAWTRSEANAAALREVAFTPEEAECLYNLSSLAGTDFEKAARAKLRHPVSPSLSTSSPELKDLLDEFALAIARTPKDVNGRVRVEDNAGPMAARSSLEELFRVQEREIQRLTKELKFASRSALLLDDQFKKVCNDNERLAGQLEAAEKHVEILRATALTPEEASQVLEGITGRSTRDKLRLISETPK